MSDDTKEKNVTKLQPHHPWGASLDIYKNWDSEGAELLINMAANPWRSDVLSKKEIELISLAVNCTCTNLDTMGTRRHIRGALDAGATREEILWVFKGGAALALHSLSLGAPIVMEEMKAAGVSPKNGPKPATPACDAMRNMGQWNTAWDPFFELSPQWTDAYFAFGINIYKDAPFSQKFIELISIAFDASITHMYAPGTRRHIKGALAAGASPEEIMTVLQLCVSMGVETFVNGLPILEEELSKK